MADSGFVPLAGAADRPPSFRPIPDGKRVGAGSGRRNPWPVFWAALYVVASLIWLLWGGPLATGWLGATLAPPFPGLLAHALFVAASGTFIYWLLYFDARTVQGAARTQDIELEEQVRARTAELTAANQALQDQIAARVQVEYALRDSEERFRQLAEHIREVFWVYGITEERLLYVSPAYEDIWARSVQSLLERPLDWIESIHPDDRSRVQTACIGKVAAGGFDEEYRIIRPDGAMRWIWSRGFPIRDTAGSIYRIAGLAEDLTARKLAEDQLRRQQADLTQTSQLSLAVEMASNLAHDINQPLAAIVAYGQACLSLLRRDRIDPRELNGVLEEMVKQGLRAGDIVRHLRDLVRKHPTAQTILDLNALIRAVIHYAELELHWGGVALQFELAEPLPAVLADDLQTQLVVLYLMRNAIEAMYETTAGPRWLIVRTVLEDPDTVLVTLSDSGPGLGPEAAERLFQPFFSTKPGGMGLGLSASRSIIESQGGRIWVTPNPDRGVSFHVTLPVYHAPGAPPTA